VKAHCLPFGQIPHTTRLFLDFLAYSPKVKPFYPRPPYFKEWVREEASALRYDSSRRERVSAILKRQNESWNASSQTLANLERLRARGLGLKRSLALREFALGVEALERFVREEPLHRVHECVFAVLALESEPVDPRL